MTVHFGGDTSETLSSGFMAAAERVTLSPGTELACADGARRRIEVATSILVSRLYYATIGTYSVIDKPSLFAVSINGKEMGYYELVLVSFASHAGELEHTAIGRLLLGTIVRFSTFSK